VRQDRRKRVVLVASSVALVGLGVTAWWILREPAKGRLLCPATPIASSSQIRDGSYVVLQLISRDSKFAEPTWGKVTGRTLFGDLEVEIVGEIDEVGAAQELQTQRHGYAIGQTIDVHPRCVWDLYHPPSGTAKLVCGSALSQIPADAGVPNAPDPDANRLRRDDDAAVVIAAQGQPTELLWLRVESSSPGAQSFTGRVIDPPLHTEVHGIEQGDTLQFVRDCVVDVRIGPGT
jgi:hypothetical protein